MTPFRSAYWEIGPVWLFYGLAIFASLTFLAGIAVRVNMWRKGTRPSGIDLAPSACIRTGLDVLTGRRIFRGDLSAGFMHLSIFLGFTGLFIGTVLVSIDHWFFPFLKGPLYLWSSLLMELLGLLLSAGLVWALIRRYLIQVPRLERRPRDLILPGWLLVVTATGFLLEGSRLAAQQDPWSAWSFAGAVVSPLFRKSDFALQYYRILWWGHAVLSLGLIAAIPFSKALHLIAGPLGILLQGGTPEFAPAQSSGKQSRYSLRDLIAFDACTRCGRCVEVCPAVKAGEPFAPRDFIRWAKAESFSGSFEFPKFLIGFQGRLADPAPGLEEERIWHCTTCRACLEVCPVYVGTPEIIRKSRSKVVEEGIRVPPLLSQALKNVYKYGNPWEAKKKTKSKWDSDLLVSDYSRELGDEAFCLYVDCSSMVESRAQSASRAVVQVLNRIGVPFGILGRKEPCCGDIARRAGEEGLFEMQAEECAAKLMEAGVHNLIATSPHCCYTFRNEYPAFLARANGAGASFKTRHYSELLEELIRRGDLSLRKTLSLKAAFHDPCYLGRHQGIFDAPRNVIDAVPGIRRVEMAHRREDSLCCGGGGGRAWQADLPGKEKISEIRIREAVDAGAEILVTACPLCLIMLEDARKTARVEDRLRVVDLGELVLESMAGC